MRHSKIVGLGHHVPETVITNAIFLLLMDTTDEWITERTGIKESAVDRSSKRYRSQHGRQSHTTCLAAREPH
jgi:3-oxoacyl-[acyl-carrier-protein] synthase III